MFDKRSSIILNYLKQMKNARIRELCDMFPEYSEMTIRRDLIQLERNGYIQRTHGGAQICQDSVTEYFHYGNRSVLALEEKRQIAIKASLLLEEGMFIYLDAGTTNLEFARLMPDIPLFVMTNGPTICFELSQKKNIDVILTGGVLSKSVMSLSGPLSVQSLANVNFDMAFIGASGFTVEKGFSNALMLECELKRHAASRASKVVMMLDHTKVGKNRQFVFAKTTDADLIISDKQFDESMQSVLDKHKITVL